MEVVICKTKEEASKLAAQMITAQVKKNPKTVLGLATGSTPVLMYTEMAKAVKEKKVSYKMVKTWNLDEYVGLPGTHDQSYRYFMNDNLFDHINIDKANTYVAKGTGDVTANLKEFNEILDKTEIEIQVLGVGPDGHLGFNEPGETLYDGAHEETLDDSTIEANKRFFASKEDVPTHAVTMGMGNIMRAKRLIMIISGNKQEAATKLLIEDKIDPKCPCTFMRMHRDATVVIEKKLADEIGYKG